MNITPGDFAVMVSHLPYNKNKDEIIEWINRILNNVEVIQINLAYDISEVVAKLRKLDKFHKIKANYHLYEKKYNVHELNSTIEELENEIQKYKDNIDTDDNSLRYMGRAIIIFDKQSQAERMVWYFRTHWIIRIFYTMLK